MSDKTKNPPPVPYVQDIQGVFDSGMLTQEAYQEALDEVADARQKLRTYGEEGHLQMLEAVFWRKDLGEITSIGKHYRRFHSVLVIGMGGASLSGKALSSIFQSWVMSDSSFPFIYFLDNLDPEVFWELMSVLNPRTTGVLVISKSGETPETLLLLMRCLEYWQDFLTPQELGSHFTAVTTSGSTLSKIARHFHCTQLEHPHKIGGRFSCFSVVGLLPLFISGGDPLKVREGGSDVIKRFFSEKKTAPMEGAAVILALAKQKNITSHVLMSYGDSFQPFLAWQRQLVSESLGKASKGFTPFLSLGPADQHSQLQLYLDGPKDKFFTIFSERHLPREKPKHELWRNFSEINFLAYTPLESLVHAEKNATTQVLVERGCPVRTINVATFNETSVGALFAHFMIEVLLLAKVMEVNPFSQPAVDSIKALAKRFLTHPASS